MSNHPRGSCVFMCVLLCIGVLLAKGFSHLWKYSLTDKWMIFSFGEREKKKKKLQTRQINGSCAFSSLFIPSISNHLHSPQFWILSFSWHLNSSPGLEMITCWDGFRNPHINKQPTPQLISVSLVPTPTHTCASTQRELFQKEIGSTLSAYLACVQCAANW